MAVQRFILTNKWAGVLPDIDHRLESGSWNFASQGFAASSEALPNNTTAHSKPLALSGPPRQTGKMQVSSKQCAEPPEGDSIDDPAELGKYNFELLAEHNLVEQGNKLYRCDICGGTYRHAFSLKRHYLRTHINHIYLSSSDISNCNINLSVQEEMDREDLQAKVKRSGSTHVTMAGLYRCNTCLQLFDQLADLKHHVFNHPSSPSSSRFPCTQCKMSFTHKQNLVRHTSVHSGEKPYTCRYCYKGFPTATNQRRHERIHEGLKPYLCPHCPSHFSQSGDLKKHIRKLHLEFFHPCAFCLKYFSKECDLKEHVVSHGKSLELNSRVLKRKLVNCKNREVPPHANRLANGLTARKLFQQGHFRCVICKKRFTSRLGLLQHQKTTHSPTTTSIQPPPAAPPPNPTHRISAAAQNLSNVAKLAHFQNAAESHYLFAPSKYFATVSQNIAQNLQDYVDGKLTKKQKFAADDHELLNDRDGSLVARDIPWSTYNFPPDFTGIGKGNRWTVKKETTLADESCEDSSYNGSGLSSGGLDDSYDEMGARAADDDDSSFEVLDLSVAKVLPNVERAPDKLGAAMLFICHACGERFLSLDAIEEHKVNNHPNVDCTHLEIEGAKNVPVAELFLPRCSPVGVLQRCPVPPLYTCGVAAQLRCTKCQEAFVTNAELHEHILLCGGHVEHTNGRKHRAKRKMNRGMKRRLDDDPGQIRRTGPYNTRKLKKEPFDWLLDYQRPAAPCYTPVEAEVSLMCDGCNRKFKYSSVLERHQKSCLGNLGNLSAAVVRADAMDSVRRKHSCVYCHRSFTYVASLKKHMEDFCPLKFASAKKTKAATRKPIQGFALKKRLKPKKKKVLKFVKRKINKGLSAVSPRRPIPIEVKKGARRLVGGSASSSQKNKPVAVVKQEVVIELDSTALATKQDVVEEAVAVPKAIQPVKEESEVPIAPKEPEVVPEIAIPPKESVSVKLVVEASVDVPEPNKEVAVKVEGDNAGVCKREQCHTCPNCMRTFTYLANFKKHLNDLCPLRSAGKENAGLTPKASQADEEKVDDPPAAVSISTAGPPPPPAAAANLRSKVTESYVTMLKDRLSHKLNTLATGVRDGKQDERVGGEASGRTKAGKQHYDWYRGSQRRGILNRLRRLDTRSASLAEKRKLACNKAAAAKDDEEEDDEEDDRKNGRGRPRNAVKKPVLKSMKTRSETAARSSRSQRGNGRLVSTGRQTMDRKAKGAIPSVSSQDDSPANCTDSDLEN